MDASAAMREMVGAAALTHKQIELRANKYNGWVGQTLARPRPGADLLADIARACGYRLDLVPINGGDAITIGDDAAPDLDDAPSIDQARAMIARGLAMLDQIGD